jgi:hypothetical protein
MAAYPEIKETSVAMPILLPPAPIAPLSPSTVGSQEPRLAWRVAERDEPRLGLTEVELCRDRACAFVIERLRSATETAAPAQPLPVGPVYWRLRSVDVREEGRPSLPASAFGPVLEFFVPSAPAESRRTAEPDLNGVGFADIALAMQDVRNGTRAGVVYYGGPNPTLPVVLTAPEHIDATWGRTVAITDVTGDGFADLVVGGDMWAIDPGWNCADSGGPGVLAVYAGTGQGVTATPVSVRGRTVTLRRPSVRPGGALFLAAV